MWTSIDTLWDLTNNIGIFTQESYNSNFDRNPNPTFINEMQTKGISNGPRPNNYNRITNRRYKIWTSQRRIPYKFTVLEEPKEEAKPHVFSDFYSIILHYNKCMLFIRLDWKEEKY